MTGLYIKSGVGRTWTHETLDVDGRTSHVWHQFIFRLHVNIYNVNIIGFMLCDRIILPQPDFTEWRRGQDMMVR